MFTSKPPALWLKPLAQAGEDRDLVCLSYTVDPTFLQADEVAQAGEAAEGWGWSTWWEAEEPGVWSAGWS